MKRATAICLLALIPIFYGMGCKSRSDFGEISAKKADEYLTEAEKQELLKIARETVNAWVSRREVPEFDVPEGILTRKGAAFTTLRKKGKLRGCIGHTIARIPLWQCVREVAISAATHDRRFPPVRPEELPGIEVEVSVLTPLKLVKSVDEIEMGRHGVVVMKDSLHAGVFLPQVATETGWGRETFLSNLCSQKAGLLPDCWKSSSTKVFTFKALVFSEHHP